MANKDFFLNSDDAQTLGNINYMRKSVRVRHTFPKTLKNPNGFATEKEVSSSAGRFLDAIRNSVETPIVNQTSFSSTTNTNSTDNTPSTPKPIEITPKARPQGTSMDMFRNMARNIGKK